MQHPALMCVMHPTGNGRDQPRRSPRLEAAYPSRFGISDFGFRILAESLAQVRPFDKCHAEVVLPLVLADFVNWHNVRMRETSGGFGFGFETLHHIRRGIYRR